MLAEEAAGAAPAFDRATELRLRAAHLIALLFRRPEPSTLQHCAERPDALVAAAPPGADVDCRVSDSS